MGVKVAKLLDSLVETRRAGIRKVPNLRTTSLTAEPARISLVQGPGFFRTLCTERGRRALSSMPAAHYLP